MNRDDRDRSLREYAEYHTLWRARGDPKRGITGDEAKQLREEARAAYFDSLPIVKISRCPICDAELMSQFDPWGQDGFWWQQRELGLAKAPIGCEHFRVLTGAVHLGDAEPKGGKEEAHIGPDVPYVIPAVLELPSMVAVVSAVAMDDGATAYPIAYFSTEVPGSGSLTATWRYTSYNFKTKDGKSSWAIKNDPWEFDLARWLSQGKIRWIMPKDPEMRLADPGRADCFFLDLPGKRRMQVVVKNKLKLKHPPNPDSDPDPFSL